MKVITIGKLDNVNCITYWTAREECFGVHLAQYFYDLILPSCTISLRALMLDSTATCDIFFHFCTFVC